MDPRSEDILLFVLYSPCRIFMLFLVTLHRREVTPGHIFHLGMTGVSHVCHFSILYNEIQQVPTMGCPFKLYVSSNEGQLNGGLGDLMGHYELM